MKPRSIRASPDSRQVLVPAPGGSVRKWPPRREESEARNGPSSVPARRRSHLQAARGMSAAACGGRAAATPGDPKRPAGQLIPCPPGPGVACLHGRTLGPGGSVHLFVDTEVNWLGRCRRAEAHLERAKRYPAMTTASAANRGRSGRIRASDVVQPWGLVSSGIGRSPMPSTRLLMASASSPWGIRRGTRLARTKRLRHRTTTSRLASLQLPRRA